MMWRPDFQVLVPFVKSTEKYDCSSAKVVDPKKCKLEQLATISNKQGNDIRKFYEDLVNSDEIITPWSDTIQNKDTEITSEPLPCRTNNGKSSTCSKTKLHDYLDSSKNKTRVEVASDDISTTTNCPVFKHGDNYESKTETSVSLHYGTNHGKSSRYLKRNFDDLDTSKQKNNVVSLNPDTTTSKTTNYPVFKPDVYKSKLNTSITSEFLDYKSNSVKTSSHLKRKNLDYSTSSKTRVTSTYKTCSEPERDNNYKTKLNTTRTSESLTYCSNNSKTNPYLKRKNLDNPASSKTLVSSTSRSSSDLELGINYKTKLNSTKLSEPFPYSSDNSKISSYLEYQAPSKTPVITSTIKNLSESERCNNYKTKLDTTKTSEVLDYSTNTVKSRTYLKNKSISSSSKTHTATTNANSLVSEKPCDSYELNLDIEKQKTNAGTVEIPSNSIPPFCRNNDDIIKKFSQEHIQNLVLKCAQEGDLPGLKLYMESGSVDVNCTDSFGWTPLMCASFSGHIDVVKFLLSVDGVDDSYRNNKRQSALGLSSKTGHYRIRKLLENHRRKSTVSASSHKDEEAQYSSQKPEDQAQSSTSEYFCDVCKMQVKNTTKSTHESSTLHLLNLHPKPLPQSYFLSEQNRGFQIMVKTGWDESKGLGPTGEGRRIPIKTILKQDRKGFGVKSSNMAKVSHFDARDTNAVKHKQSVVIKALNKKKLASIHKREKRKERYLRRCLDFD